MENLVSDNRSAMLEILADLRARTERDEILQLFIVTEELSGFASLWTGSEDRFAIGGFAMCAAMSRMGFIRPPEQT